MELIPRCLNLFASLFVPSTYKCQHDIVESKIHNVNHGSCFPFSFCRNGSKLNILDESLSQANAIEQLSEIMETALRNCQEDDHHHLPHILIRGLLEDPAVVVSHPLPEEEEIYTSSNENGGGALLTVSSQISQNDDGSIAAAIHDNNNNNNKRDSLLPPHIRKDVGTSTMDDAIVILKGVPRRPYYKELSHRLVLLMRHYHPLIFSNEDDPTTASRTSLTFPRPLLPAVELGFTEEEPPSFQLLENPVSITTVTHWLRTVHSTTLLQLLGMRQTPGSEVWNLPPDIPQLLEAAQQPCSSTKKNHSDGAKPPSHYYLTVAARAHAKHAHRGSDNYFGHVTGTVATKNEMALHIVKHMISNAVWMNCHVFGGVSEPVLEIRVKEGYGARWSADWGRSGSGDAEHDSSRCGRPLHVTFRGFLEPHMKDGFEKQWRH
mmetsp:Transcript_27864/g.42665  ORF Transcript_27864/g.42665 Transcript_27864/m.42665 type:complete len:434 (+) Transcript_27864:60-1361(+)